MGNIKKKINFLINNSEEILRPHFISKEVVHYSNKFFKIDYVNAKFKNFEKDYFIVNFGERVGAVIINENSILLVGQYRLIPNSTSWEIPGGSVNDDESPELAIVRECKEETGFKIKIQNELIIYYPGLDNVNNKTTIFIASVENKNSSSKIDQLEIETIKWIPIDECIEMIFNKKILDALTISGILAYKASLK